MLSDNVLYKLVSCSDLKKKKEKEVYEDFAFYKNKWDSRQCSGFFYVQDSVDCCGSSTLM